MSKENHHTYPGIVSTKDILSGQPRLAGRRISVGNIVFNVAVKDSIHFVTEQYGITEQEIKQALHYCKSLQCVEDRVLQLCNNCTLGGRQEGQPDNIEEYNWKRAERLFKKNFS